MLEQALHEITAVLSRLKKLIAAQLVNELLALCGRQS
jgi:hypothetical protein